MENKTVTTQSVKQFGVHFGATSDKLSKQIKKQGFKYDENTVDHFEQDAAALNRLRIRGYLTDSATDSATKKLFNKIKKHISDFNK